MGGDILGSLVALKVQPNNTWYTFHHFFIHSSQHDKTSNWTFAFSQLTLPVSAVKFHAVLDFLVRASGPGMKTGSLPGYTMTTRGGDVSLMSLDRWSSCEERRE